MTETHVGRGRVVDWFADSVVVFPRDQAPPVSISNATTETIGLL